MSYTCTAFIKDNEGYQYIHTLKRNMEHLFQIRPRIQIHLFTGGAEASERVEKWSNGTWWNEQLGETKWHKHMKSKEMKWNQEEGREGKVREGKGRKSHEMREMKAWKNERKKDWTNELAAWLNDSLADWLTGWLADWLTDGRTDRRTGCVSQVFFAQP